MRSLGKRARDESGKYPVNENDEENVAGFRLTTGLAPSRSRMSMEAQEQ
jgi:hypothetical protein